MYQNMIIPVCSGRDAVQAANCGLPVLHFYLSLSEQGRLGRKQLPTSGVRCIIGLSEPAHPVTACNPTQIADALLFEATHTQALGIFADFENATPAVQSLLDTLDARLFAHGLPLYLPLSLGYAPPHATLTVSTAISGGSLKVYFHELGQQYGTTRLAAFLQPISHDFPLPSDPDQGIPLSEQQRLDLLAQTHAQVFFSSELCAKYFTYTSAEGQAHFVLFDDASTLGAKLTQLHACGIGRVFTVWPDAQLLLTQS